MYYNKHPFQQAQQGLYMLLKKGLIVIGNLVFVKRNYEYMCFFIFKTVRYIFALSS